MKSDQKSLTYYGLASYLYYMRQYKLRIVLVSTGYAFATVCLSVIPVFIGQLVGELAKTSPDQGFVTLWVSILVGCSLLHQISWHGIEYFYAKYILPPMYLFEEILVKSTLSRPYPYFTDKFTGKIGASIDIVTQNIRDFTSNYFYTYIIEVVRLASIGFILLSINIQTLAIFIIGIGLMLLIGTKTYEPFTREEKKFSDLLSSKTGWIVDAVANFSNIKSFQTEKKEIHLHRLKLDAVSKQGQTATLADVIFWARVGTVVRFFIWPVTIVMNVILFQQGELSIAQLTTLLSVILLFSDYIWGIVGALIRFNLNMARLEESYTYLFGRTNISKELPMITPHNEKVDFRHSIEFKNLEFSYPDSPHEVVLKNISIHIKHGEKIGIVGRSGSGKSTLTKILLGYFPVKEGSILLDDVPISSKQLSSFVSFVPQDTSLFHRTLGENIAYAAELPVTHKDIIAAAKQANADDFIHKTEYGYNSLVGERGIKLSGGQRQRIAIARAILRQSPILVLDEATSALDSESELLIQKSLDKLTENKTTIVIAHRLSTIAQLDRIIVLDNGRIIEDGSHTELLKMNGTYAKLWSHQSGGFIEE